MKRLQAFKFQIKPNGEQRRDIYHIADSYPKTQT
ncbi:helix-turn-helix domain-containing protein [Desulforhopalus vacuolatus]